MNNIDLLLEKFLTGFKKYGHIIEVFQDPTRKELSEFSGKWRFIADERKKAVYVWDAMTAIHADAYVAIKKDHDPEIALIYKHPSILPGTVDNGVVIIHSAEYMSQANRKGIKERDWAFLEKFFNEKEKNSFEDAMNKL